MQNIPSTNLLVRLLGALPAQISAAKQRAIRAELKAIGKLGHYRQSVLREGWKLGDTHVACAEVLMKHLGVSLAFFTAPQEHRRLGEVARIVAGYASADAMTDTDAQSKPSV